MGGLAVILAGGLGKRLRPITERIPKPMIEVAGKPILQWQVEFLSQNGINKFIFLVGYKAEVIERYFNDGSEMGVEILYSREKEPLGTAGALKNAEHLIKEEKFLMLNGDIITNLNPSPLLQAVEDNAFMVAIASVPLPSPYGILEIEDDIVIGFKEKPQIPGIWINAGIYAMRKEIIEMCPTKGDIEKTVFPILAEQKRIRVVKYEDVVWKSIDSHKDIDEATKLIEKINNS